MQRSTLLFWNIILMRFYTYKTVIQAWRIKVLRGIRGLRTSNSKILMFYIRSGSNTDDESIRPNCYNNNKALLIMRARSSQTVLDNAKSKGDDVEGEQTIQLICLRHLQLSTMPKCLPRMQVMSAMKTNRLALWIVANFQRYEHD
jgi:hypothetical protein